MSGEAVAMYHRVKREPKEGTISEAIKCHSQACGFVAYALDLTPDEVAREVGGGPAVPANEIPTAEPSIDQKQPFSGRSNG